MSNLSATYYDAGQAAIRHFLDLNQSCRTVGNWIHGDEAQGAFAELIVLYAGPAALHYLDQPGDDFFTERGDDRLAGAIAVQFWPNTYTEALHRASILAEALINEPAVWQAVEAFAEFLIKTSTIATPTMPLPHSPGAIQ